MGLRVNRVWLDSPAEQLSAGPAAELAPQRLGQVQLRADDPWFGLPAPDEEAATGPLPVVPALTAAVDTAVNRIAEHGLAAFDPAALPPHPLRLAPSPWRALAGWTAGVLQLALGASLGALAVLLALAWIVQATR